MTQATEHKLSPEFDQINKYKNTTNFNNTDVEQHENLDLPDVVGIMGRQVPICFHNLKKEKNHERYVLVCAQTLIKVYVVLILWKVTNLLRLHSTCSSLPRAVKKSLYWQLYNENK